MPDQGTTHYEERDAPDFIAEMNKLCAACKVIYQNVDSDSSKQQQQFNSVISKCAKGMALNPYRLSRQ